MRFQLIHLLHKITEGTEASLYLIFINLKSLWPVLDYKLINLFIRGGGLSELQDIKTKHASFSTL